MEWTFNRIFVMNDLELFYGFLIFMILGIFLAVVFVMKELNKKDDNK